MSSVSTNSTFGFVVPAAGAVDPVELELPDEHETDTVTNATVRAREAQGRITAAPTTSRRIESVAGPGTLGAPVR